MSPKTPPHRRPRFRRGPRLDEDVMGRELAHELRDFMRRLDHGLGDLIHGADAPPELTEEDFDHAEHFLAPGVPRIRPLLVLLSARAAEHHPDELAFGPDEQAAEHVAVAAELLHLAIAVHDTALGRQGGRRRRAARRLLGGAVGWLGGNHLTLRALELARHAPSPEVVSDMVDTMREITDGHTLVQGIQDGPATPDQAMAVAEGYTGAVFSFACRAGARLVRADRPRVTALGRYGRHAGIAWHLAEDLGGPEGDTETLALRIEDHAAHRRPSLAVGLAAQEDEGVIRDWQALCQHPNPMLAERLAIRLERSGALQLGHERLVREAWAARKALNTLQPSPHREALDQIVRDLVSPRAVA